MVKRSLFLILLLIASGSVFGQNKDALMGRWLTNSGDAQILITATKGKYSGKIIWLKNPNDKLGKLKVDEKNPNANLVKRPLLGLDLLNGFTYSEEGIWEGGTIYDPKTGKTYSCKISMVDYNHIHVRGFVGISLLGRTETWSRLR